MKKTVLIGVSLTLASLGLSGCTEVSQPTDEGPSFGLAKGTTKVTVCHVGKSITIGAPSVAAHLAHGDRQGPCAPACVAPPSGLVSWWPGDGNAEDVVDGNNGILRGDATFVPGMVGQAFSFDGDGDFVEVPDAPNLNPSSQISIDLWMKPDLNNPMNGCCQGLVQAEFYFIAIGAGSVPGTGGVLMAVHEQFSGDAFALSPGEWHHVAGVFDGTSVNLHVNGQLVAEAPASGLIAPSTPGHFLGIGTQVGGIPGPTPPPPNAGHFNGLIDEVELFNRALSTAEIKAIFDAGSAGKCKP